MSQPNRYELYYVPTNEMIQMINNIHVTSNRFQQMFETLPKIAQNQFLNECIVEELYNTNDLEGIRSTRGEIAKSTKEVILKRKSKKRFESMIKLYLRLISSDIEFPLSPQDIRKIYDEITNGEIEQEELPDGDIFRKETTYILKKSGSGKVVHQGMTPELEVVSATSQLLKFMNEDDNIPIIIKVAIGHYFIEVFLGIIFETLEQMTTELKEKSKLLEMAYEKIKNEALLKDDELKSIMFVLAQNHFFESGTGLTVKKLSEVMKKSERTMRKAMKELSTLSIIEQRGERPVYFCIKPAYFEG